MGGEAEVRDSVGRYRFLDKQQTELKGRSAVPRVLL